MTTEELTPQELAEAKAVRTILATTREFRPFAVFDEQLDCIRVITRDCSFTEIRVDNFLTVLEANYPRASAEYVGFTIKGVAHLCETHGIPRTGPWKLAQFLDAILLSSEASRPLVHSLAMPIADEHRIEEVERLAA